MGSASKALIYAGLALIAYLMLKPKSSVYTDWALDGIIVSMGAFLICVGFIASDASTIIKTSSILVGIICLAYIGFLLIQLYPYLP
jgi:hypothetical protein